MSLDCVEVTGTVLEKLETILAKKTHENWVCYFPTQCLVWEEIYNELLSTRRGIFFLPSTSKNNLILDNMKSFQIE